MPDLEFVTIDLCQGRRKRRQIVVDARDRQRRPGQNQFRAAEARAGEIYWAGRGVCKQE
jgi:hypothetical protein